MALNRRRLPGRQSEDPPPYPGRDSSAQASFTASYPFYNPRPVSIPSTAPLQPTGPLMAFPGHGLPTFHPQMSLMNSAAMPAGLPQAQAWLAPAPGNVYIATNSLLPPNNNLPFEPVRAFGIMEPGVSFDPNSDPPFSDRTQGYRPRRHGVLKITNIPYTLTIPEIQQFICKYIPLDSLIKPHRDGFPIHIIMERSTGKTMDCYIEIVSPEAAAEDWERAFGLKLMRLPKIGQRNVTVELSNQAELMKDLFPRAISIHWDVEENGVPKSYPNRDVYSSGFKGFLTNEELTCMVRHAEAPQRSQFAARSLQRTYESMISTVYKFPWYAVSMYTIRQRDSLFDSYRKQLDVLIFKVDPSNILPREVGLDNKLLMDFLFAGMNCSAFSQRQLAAIVDASRIIGPGLPISRHARNWPFQTLSADPVNMSEQDISMWLDVLNMGMSIIEGENRPFIGIVPYLHVDRDLQDQVFFQATEQGKELSREEFALLEKEFMYEMMHKGWVTYMSQLGIDPPPGLDKDYEERIKKTRAANKARPAHRFVYNPLTGHYSVNGVAPPAVDDVFGQDDNQDVHAGESSEQARARAAEVALASYLELLRDTFEEDNAAAAATSDNLDAAVEGLGSSLNNITLSTSTAVQHVASPLDTEAPFLERRTWTHRHNNSDSALHNVDNPFAGLGLGNGIISPPRISTARNKQPDRTGSQPPTPSPNMGLGPLADYADAFQAPGRERGAVPIRTPDGTPFRFPRSTTAADVDAASPFDGVTESVGLGTGIGYGMRDTVYDLPNFATPPVSAGTPVAGTMPAVLPSTPRRRICPGDNPLRNFVVMPAAGKPSPGHTRNYGMSSGLTFGGVSASATATGSPSRRGVASGSPGRSDIPGGTPARPALGTSGFGLGLGRTNSASNLPTLDGAARRARARSAFSITETIDEEEAEDEHHHDLHAGTPRTTF